ASATAEVAGRQVAVGPAEHAAAVVAAAAGVAGFVAVPVDAAAEAAAVDAAAEAVAHAVGPRSVFHLNVADADELPRVDVGDVLGVRPQRPSVAVDEASLPVDAADGAGHLAREREAAAEAAAVEA